MKKDNKEKLGKSFKIFLILIFIVAIVGINIYIIKNYLGTDNIFNSRNPKEVKVPEIKVYNNNSSERNIGVMINNHPEARKNHAGLQDAHTIYELIVEGGLTRYFAVFKDKDTTKIGSVRSSRHDFLDYAMEHDAIYTHFGWSPQATSDISSFGINNINGLYDDIAFWRDYKLNVNTEHTAFTNISKIKEACNYRKYRLTTSNPSVLKYTYLIQDLSSMENSQVANEVSITYSDEVTNSYVYDSEKQVYNRSVNNKVHKDLITGEQYNFKNIITYQVKNIVLDSYGRQDLQNVGSGEGYYITNGYAIKIKWEKSSRETKTIYRYLNGEELLINDGNTFIQIQPKGEELIIK